MQGAGESSSMLTRMAEMRLVFEREIPIRKLGKLKGKLREAEDALVKVLAVKTRKEAKRMATMESVAVMKARVEELKRIVKHQSARKDECAAIISQQSEALTACKEKCNKNNEHREQTEEAISWYNRVLGFRVECGNGVKFIFTNINLENLNEEYSFTIRHENEVYTLLQCNPHLRYTKELVNELNKTNGLFNFVRTMREKFQASVSNDLRYESPVNENNSISRKTGKVHTIHSPGSACSLRRSSRLKGKN